MILFERSGRFFFEKKRSWFLFGLLVFPFVFSLALLSPRFYSICEIEQSFEKASRLAQCAMTKREEKELFLRRYSHVDPYFINQHLESLALLQDERKELEIMKNHPACPNRGAASQRIEWLQGPDNRLVFAEENRFSSKKIKETEERLMHPVEIDTDDLEHLLCLIEDVPVGPYQPHSSSPQLIIQDFTLVKKSPATFTLNLSLIKREWIDTYDKKK